MTDSDAPGESMKPASGTAPAGSDPPPVPVHGTAPDPDGMAAQPGAATEAVAPVSSPPTGAPKRRRHEFLYFAVRNKKLLVGISVVGFFVLVAIFGPWLTSYAPLATGNTGWHPPSGRHWLGTTYFDEDVFSQLVYGIRASFEVGVLGGCFSVLLGMLVGFTAGYRGGWMDEILNLVTNVVIVIPLFAMLLIIGGYLHQLSLLWEAALIGMFSWPWSARAIRAQTFTLKNREFVGLARLSGESSAKIIWREIAPNMSSYLMLTFILLFGGAILTASFIDFVGLGPQGVVTLGTMMNNAFFWDALDLHIWWWFLPPGAIITCIVGGLYLTNAGLDEVFNPKLRSL
jgi:peptide/nickel transport system permease protein